MHKLTTALALNALALLLSAYGTASSHEKVDYALFGSLLSAHVGNGVVDYKGFKTDEAQLDEHLAAMSAVDPERLPDREERMAFYINLYNAWTIKLILTRYPDLESIKDLGGIFQSPWEKKIVKLNGATVTLDHIEHEVLRPKFKDPRIHFAVNCASKSCPPLLNEPYSGDTLDRQLDSVTKAFINDPQRNYLQDNVLYVSRIFKWYGKDFKEGIPAFFKQYAEQPLKRKLEDNSSRIEVKFLEYDWSLNNG